MGGRRRRPSGPRPRRPGGCPRPRPGGACPRPQPPRRGRGHRRRAGQAEALWKASAANAERWRDPEAAEAAGFRFRDDEAGPGRRVRFLHVPNPAWRMDGRVLDPARPETLVYWTGPGDRLTLVGVMYTRRRPDHPLARPRALPRSRHPGQAGPADGACPEGQVFRRSGEMMHVWFTDDLITAFARRAPLAALRAAAT